ncbi:MAG: hypothetical protein VB081_03200 [Christensenella sp.]|uniref:hypothetical protein n=1 Tax=Christensenella sp. TaxID=1935934 RepID=UPI002B21F4DB|nr:hypothetical protein [Christensenella sp.]MEA5002483.1 hypothetical protein [Christensenella sp.]
MICEIGDAPYIVKAMGTGNNTMWRQQEIKRDFEQCEHIQEKRTKRMMDNVVELEKLYGGAIK